MEPIADEEEEDDDDEYKEDEEEDDESYEEEEKVPKAVAQLGQQQAMLKILLHSKLLKQRSGTGGTPNMDLRNQKR